MDLIIKKATIKELRDIQNLSQFLCKRENSRFDPTVDCGWPFSRKGKQHLKIRLTGKDGCVFIATLNAAVVGYLMGGVVKAEMYRNISFLTEIENVFVLNEYRDHGIGAKLIDAFVEWSKKKNVKKIRIVASRRNFRGINFYKSKRFKEYDMKLERDI